MYNGTPVEIKYNFFEPVKGNSIIKTNYRHIAAISYNTFNSIHHFIHYFCLISEALHQKDNISTLIENFEATKVCEVARGKNARKLA